MKSFASPSASSAPGAAAGPASAPERPDHGAPQDFLAVLARMARTLWRPEMRRWRVRMAAALVVTLVAKLLSVMAPVWLGEGINRAASGAADAGAAFLAFLLIFAVARFLSNALPQVRDGFFSRVTQDANRLVAVDAFRHAQAQSLQFHLTRRAGAVNRVIERGAGAQEYLLRFLAFNIGPTIIELLLAAAVMAALYSWKLSLAAILTVAAYAVVTVMITEWRNTLRRSMNEADTELRAISTDTLSNFETVKAFGAEERETRRFDAAMTDYNDRFVRVTQSLNILNAAQEFIMTAGLFAAAALAAQMVFRGVLKVGDITAVILMLTNIYRPLNILGFAWREIKQGAVDIEKLYDLLDRTPDIQDRPDAIDLEDVRGEIRFENVAFVHEGRADGIADVSFTAPAGGFIGLVGPSGAGKSTILKLLLRFDDPQSGRVLIDGVDARDATARSLRRVFALVPQEVALFNDTLRFNLAYARPEASDEEIMAAARLAQLGPFIKRLPEWVDT